MYVTKHCTFHKLTSKGGLSSSITGHFILLKLALLAKLYIKKCKNSTLVIRRNYDWITIIIVILYRHRRI